MKRIIFLIVFVCMAFAANAQTNTLYFMEDVPKNTSWNPAFMPRYSGYISLFDIYGEVGNNAMMLRDFVFKRNGRWTTAFSPSESIDELYRRIGGNINGDVRFGLSVLNFGFRIKEKNFFTFDASLRGEAYSLIPKDFTRLLLYGTGREGNFDFSNADLEAKLYGELGFGFIRQINDMWSFGLKLKALIGFAGMHTNIEDMRLQTYMDRWQLLSIADAYIMTPAVKYSAANKSLSTDINAKNLFFPQGIGGAIDLGATYRPVENFTLSFAVTDLGLISWQNSSRIVNINTRGKFTFKGVEYHYRDNIDSLKSAYDRLVDNMKDSVQWTAKQGINGSINQWLTANANIGAEYGILDNKISFAAMANARINYNRIMPELTLGVNFRPADWAKFYLSHTLSTRCASTLGLGINLQAGPVNFYIISDFVPLSYVKVQNFDKAIDNTIIPYRSNRFNVQTGLAFTFGSSKDDDRDGVSNKRDKCPDTDIDMLMARCPGKKRTSFVDRDGCILDDDHDGVANCYDKCPDTPEGVTVDKNGCPIDTDGDGVPDYLDKCPDTPKGVKVDKDGCPIDTDGDGVPDYLDKCPNTPQGVAVDEKGCPKDTDGDGVPDYLDKCPNTPKGVQVDERGCPLDSDGDGVMDDKDKCPGTPKGMPVDKDGCPKDTDGDGVPDYKDKCPGTPKAAIGYVDENGCPRDTDGDGVPDYQDDCPTVKGVKENRGCPAVKKEVLKVFKQALHGIQFDSGKATIKPVSFGVLNMVVDIMRNNPEYNLIIAGHTDSQGNDDFNMTLSDNRAAAVRQYLIDKGVSSDRLQSKGYGETKPVATNKTAAGRAQNRRVEFTVVFEKFVKADEADDNTNQTEQ